MEGEDLHVVIGPFQGDYIKLVIRPFRGEEEEEEETYRYHPRALPMDPWYP